MKEPTDKTYVQALEELCDRLENETDGDHLSHKVTLQNGIDAWESILVADALLTNSVSLVDSVSLQDNVQEKEA